MAPANLTRTRIHTIVQTNPGTHTAQTALIAGVSWNTCQHHVRVLVDEGKIVAEKIDGKIRLFDRSNGKVSGKESTAVLQCAVNRRVAAHVLKYPGKSQRELASGLDMSTTAVHRRISRLQEAGLVERLAAGRMTLVAAGVGLVDAFVEAGLSAPVGRGDVVVSFGEKAVSQVESQVESQSGSSPEACYAEGAAVGSSESAYEDAIEIEA